MTVHATPKLTVQMRGHLVYWDGTWRYLDNDQPVAEEGERPCVECGMMATLEGYDACLGKLPDKVTWACCGHGVEEGYIRWGNSFGHQSDALIVGEVANPAVDVPGPWYRGAAPPKAYRHFYADPDRKHFYVPIPKVGTNSMRATFPDWTPELYPEDMDGFAFVRDPISRWFSGINEFLNNNSNPFSQEFLDHHSTPEIPKQVAWDYMMDLARGGQFEWDDHTKPQSEFLEGFDIELIKFEHATDFVWERFKREMAHERQRDWEPVYGLTQAIQEHYAEDMALYDSAK